jgi:hypothetical protein
MIEYERREVGDYGDCQGEKEKRRESWRSLKILFRIKIYELPGNMGQRVGK